MRIEPDERYEHEEYGEVKVLKLFRRLNAADTDGTVEETIRVKYLTTPDKRLVKRGSVKSISLDTFVEKVEGDA